MSTPTTPDVAAPRTPRVSAGPRGQSPRVGNNFELYSWLFMRLSGIVLVALILTHLFVNLVVGDGINAIDFAFVAGKWSNPFWQVWDLLMLWLAMLHGANGLRTIINDYAERDGTRFWLKALLYLATVVTVVLGTLVIFTFDPCIDPASTLSVCQ